MVENAQLVEWSGLEGLVPSPARLNPEGVAPPWERTASVPWCPTPKCWDDEDDNAADSDDEDDEFFPDDEEDGDEFDEDEDDDEEDEDDDEP